MKPFAVILSICATLVLLEGIRAGAFEALQSKTCTPSTCPEGPVRLDFPNSDCTGEPVYSTFDNDWGVCNSDTLSEMTEFGYAYFSFNTDTTTSCDRSGANVTYSFELTRWGACFSNLFLRDAGATHSRRGILVGGGYMYLANVNDSFVSPQIFDYQVDVPNYVSHYDEECYSVDNCTLIDGQSAQFWRTETDEFNCQGSAISFTNRYEVLGECQNYQNISYYKSNCFEDHGFLSVWYSDSACDIPSYAYGYRDTCSANSQQTYYCTAPPIPIPDFSAPSAPSDSPYSSPSSPLAPSASPSSPSAPSSSPSSPTPASPAPSHSSSILMTSLLIILLISILQ